VKNLFDLSERTAVVTGGAGLLGVQHGVAIHNYGGIPVLADINLDLATDAARKVGKNAIGIKMDVTDPKDILQVRSEILRRFGSIDILINNAARNPKVESNLDRSLDRVEDLDLQQWNEDLDIGLTGAMLCSRYFGEQMASQKRGVILNIASDLAIIGPDQRLYEQPGLPPEKQPKKPVSYPAVKSGLLGLTRYYATFWADCGVRVNAICPGGVENGQPAEFLERIARLIPMKRMARVDEYHGAIVFLCSDASAYMTGQTLVVDGGRTIW